MTTLRPAATALAFLTLVFSACVRADVRCDDAQPATRTVSRYASGWGIDARNTRYQSESTLTATNASTLKLKWVYGLASSAPRSFPLVTDDTIFIGDAGRGVVALDRESGCERWLYPHRGAISSPILGARRERGDLLIFADRTRGVFALDAASGEPAWHAAAHDEPVPMYSGSPLIVGARVFVPVSSMEVALAVNPLYGCCTTSGGIAAFNIVDGAPLWYRPTIEQEAAVTGSHLWFVQKHGPSGAPVWSAPAHDPKRGLIYFGTGQNYSHPTTDTSDAVFAVDATTGAVRWVTQHTEGDAYTAACNVISLDHPNCPKPLGPDVDFGAAVLLARTVSGRELVIAGQKSADVHAMDPDTGVTQWSVKLGRGGIIGGVHWGMAVNEQLGRLFVPISDKAIPEFPSPGTAAPGLYALDTATGATRWHYARESRCSDAECTFGYSAAVTAANDVVVTGSMDGFLEVVSAGTGELLWEHDAWQEYESVNGVSAEGGAFDAHGPMLADDLVIVSSGYRYVGSQRGGNALLVFQLERNND